MKFTSHEVEYETDQHGVLCQIDPQPFKYDEKYVSTYDTPEYVAKDKALQLLRVGFVLASHGKEPGSLIDFGCGNGAFMRGFHHQIPMASIMGHDVSGVKIPGMPVTHDRPAADVYTFWDALEHVHDISFLADLPCETICVSLPYCHMDEIRKDQSWFDHEYKHRKPNEHVRHFDPASLEATMLYYDWKKVLTSFHEDIVRRSTHGRENILSMSFKRN